jgi:hypothetical protein
MDVNILDVDKEIRENFERSRSKIGEYRSRKIEIEETMEAHASILSPFIRSSLQSTLESLNERIKSLELNTEYNNYVIDTYALIDSYKKALSAPVRISFIGKKIDSNEKVKDIVQEFLSVAERYGYKRSAPPLTSTTCEVCNNAEFESKEDNVDVCVNCGYQRECAIGVPSHKDAKRINVTKYTYDRRVHFRDCMNQYQGKQNSTIEPCVYADLEREFERNYLLIKSDDKRIRYKNVTKENITLFLKNLKYTKHYENVNLIHYNLTGVKPDNISHLEEVLLQDFDQLTKAYDSIYKNNIERTNFINTQYVLYQLLRKHKHPCKGDDFVMLKTIERQQFHDDIMKSLFDYLGWNFNPYFF